MKHELRLYVARDGRDDNPGTAELPLATLGGAREALRGQRRDREGPVTVLVRGGTYYQKETLVFLPEDSGASDAKIIYSAAPGEAVTISAGRKLNCRWRPFRDGILMCELAGTEGGIADFDQLFVNGKRQVRARYPDRDDSAPGRFSGYIMAAGRLDDGIPDPEPGPDDDMTFSCAAPRGVLVDPDLLPRRVWKNPGEAVIHIFQSYGWGNLQWRIRRIDRERGIIWFGEGGWQMGAKYIDTPCEVDANSGFYIENVFEELDAPGEWYFDRYARILYFMPPGDLDMDAALVEVPAMKRAVSFAGSRSAPVHDLTLRGFRFAHTATTFLEPYTVPSRSDWSIHRGGAVFLEGTRGVSIEECHFDAVGGNAVFAGGYNRDASVERCLFTEAGDSAVCFVGSLEDTVGTQRSFPYECRAVNNLVRDCGVFGKQSAGVYISRAKRITAGHNDIARMPRAGICIGDGTWGGHVVEYNYIHDTCRETGDHGPFNAWGRDSYWCLSQSHEAYTPEHSLDAGRVAMDAMETVRVRNNFFRESSGWGLDLDDGASNYEIRDNLCVGVSLKLREGAMRTVRNNIWIHGANSPCFHVGNESNHDRYIQNITVMRRTAMRSEADLNFAIDVGFGEIYTLIAPPSRGPWLEEVDWNCFFSDLGEFVARVRYRSAAEGVPGAPKLRRKLSLSEWRSLGFDLHSVFADPLFVDPANGDYRLKPESPALKLGFVEFDMEHFGLADDFPARFLEIGNL